MPRNEIIAAIDTAIHSATDREIALAMDMLLADAPEVPFVGLVFTRDTFATRNRPNPTDRQILATFARFLSQVNLVAFGRSGGIVLLASAYCQPEIG